MSAATRADGLPAHPGREACNPALPGADEQGVTTRIGRIALAGVVALVVAGCGGPQHSPAEQAYLDGLQTAARDAGSGVRGYGDEDNLNLARAVCADLEAGIAPAEIARGLRGSGGPIGKVAHNVVGLAQTHLCPAG